ncbi:MAG: ATP-binding cassette domain-containing protein, partial [Planctomycetes bacterium]|nr:ATP-binding cassette domain-containing protein [Planctomycetota bacterium]
HARAARLANEQAAEATRRNLLRREAEWMRRGPPARTTKAKARIERYQALVDDAPDEPGRDLAFEIPAGPRLGEKVLRFEGVRAGYGDHVLLDGLDLEIGARTRLGIVGPNGAGKSTFLKLCLGELEPSAGEVIRGSTVRFATIDQRRSDLDPTKTVVEEVSGGNDWIVVDDRRIRVESFLEQFLFPGPMRRSRIEALSGGEKNRVLLAKLLSAGGNVLVLDEPTNDLDLMTLRVLEEALVAFPGVVLVVSHDRYFLDRVATRILHFDGRGGHQVHEGDLSGLLDRLAAERSAAEKETARAKTKRPSPGPEKPKPVKLSTREHAELDELPDRIATAEAAIARLDEALVDPSAWQDGSTRGAELTRDRERQQTELDELYARWEELETRREASIGS